MKVLIIGRGGREHTLALKVSQSELVKEVFVAPGNVGMADVASIINIDEHDVLSLACFAEDNSIDLTIVGPESSLACGVADEFIKRGLKIFAPTKNAAQIESSKDFAKKIMAKYNIPTSDYKTFDNLNDSLLYLNTKTLPIVIKEDGLKAGKGVTVAIKKEEAIDALERAFSEPSNKVVIEDYLDGFEFSIIAICNGETIIPLEVAQDHKRVFDNDLGANTGGMGAYSPVEKIDEKIVKDTTDKILKPLLKGMINENMPFTGFLFAGVMLTNDGVKTIEFNARFGDPEAECILTRLKTDFVSVLLSVLDNKTVALDWDSRYSLGVVMASENYPESSTIGADIEIPDNIDSMIFHMGTKSENGRLQTNGGRVLCVVGLDSSLQKAKEKVYSDVKKIKSDKLFFRNDIGDKML